MDLQYFINHADSLFTQIFMIVMGLLYAMAIVIGFSYKAVNIYCYFVLFPASLLLFVFKSKYKYLILPLTFLFFLIPGIEDYSVVWFDYAVVFLNSYADVFNSNYINASVYLCVLVPALIYSFAIYKRFGWEVFKIISGVVIGSAALYLLTIFPNFKPFLEYCVSIVQ
ncbi:hypothetical protein DFQ11_101614 [Winogradskyella epiphytica]|uniref:Uncharacterized protein n=1 Tax=Winogradskyella epiphytica TaxID=262005 RepID=A0A2V4YGY9_9FLAO|nr:hypothetical protein [Winogradskyella epiphytica]PYE83183.1 hypothetical protein DFQ11_101614 [Winogradskyella epiphytica]